MSLEQAERVLRMVAEQQCVDGVTDAPCAHCAASSGLTELASVKSAIPALRDALELLASFIKDAGPCDHAVNICLCGERSTLAAAQERLAKLEKP